MKNIFKNLLAIAVALIFFVIVGAIFSYLGSISLKIIYIILAIIGVAIIYIATGGRAWIVLRKIFGIKSVTDPLFDNAPYLCPWYFNEASPKLVKKNELLKWKWIEKVGEEYVGTLLLVDRNGTCYGIVKTYTYLFPSSANKKFLVWARSDSRNLGFQETNVSLYTTDDLQPIENYQELIVKFKDSKTIFFHFNSEPKSKISFLLNADAQYINCDFPADFKSFPDFCAVMEVPELYRKENAQWHNTAILLLKPNDAKIFIYPQDWFNKSDSDFGYQWITRAIISPDTGLIHGQGIRISNFILDKTNRQRQHL